MVVNEGDGGWSVLCKWFYVVVNHKKQFSAKVYFLFLLSCALCRDCRYVGHWMEVGLCVFVVYRWCVISNQ